MVLPLYPSGDVIKLVPDVNAKQNAVPFDLTSKVKGEALGYSRYYARKYECQ
jgi:hypothetical protein